MENVLSQLLRRAGSNGAADLIALILTAGILAGCGSAQKQQPQARRSEAVPVVVAPVEQKDVPVQIKAIGSVEAFSTVQVKSQINGELTGVGPGNSADQKVKALINMINSAGDLLATGQMVQGCQQLADIYLKVDGVSPPPDFVTGPAIPVDGGYSIGM